ncbi:hypothetical protein AAIM60_12690 [Pseudomonas lijiangensis]|uniref:hypothetical protein n=1 Tax=Pseudomonas lijiangensis TaxID=2995658 RepID=UPI0031BA980A
MNIIRCDPQRNAKTIILDSIEKHGIVLLQGAPLSGKTTVIEQLTYSLNSRSSSASMIRSCNIDLYSSLNHAVVQAFGLPHWVASAADQVFFSALRELVAKKPMVLLIDDIDVFFGGVRYSEACSYISSLYRYIGAIKIIGSFYNSTNVTRLVTNLFPEKPLITELASMQLNDDFRKFVCDVAHRHGLRKYQVKDEAFVGRLYQKTAGASGSVIQSIALMARTGLLVNGRVASVDLLANFWMERS